MRLLLDLERKKESSRKIVILYFDGKSNWKSIDAGDGSADVNVIFVLEVSVERL
jgi:hypothetical protein